MKRTKWIALLLAAALLVGLVPGASAAWYDEAKSYIQRRGVLTEVPGGFRAGDKVTRAEVAYGLYALSGKGEAGAETEDFSDVTPVEWFYRAVRWCREAGLVKGNGANAFNPSECVTRAELSAMLERFLNNNGWVSMPGNLANFIDAPQVPAWAESGMNTCIGYKIIQGTDEGYLNPTGDCSWAELATVLWRVGVLQDNGEEPEEPEAPQEPGLTASVDKYGNLVTTVTAKDMAAMWAFPGDLLSVKLGSIALAVPYGNSILDVDAGRPVALLNSDGRLTLCINMGGFAPTYKVDENTPVTVVVADAGGCAEQVELRKVSAPDDRAWYPSEEAYANFRCVAMGSMPEGVLYRSSSPINPAMGERRFTADKLQEVAEVRTVVNLADCRFRYRGYDGFDYTIYATRDIVSLNMGADFLCDAFSEDMKNGTEFITEQPGPYLIHGDDGVIRTGFVAMVLGALMGGTKDELIADYMRSFEDYYRVEKGSDAWTAFRDGCALRCLMRFTHAASESELDEMDLSKAAETYLTGTVELTADQVALLKAHLSGKWETPAE